MKQEEHEYSRGIIKKAPGIYFIYDKRQKELLYIGITKERKDLCIRIRNHMLYPTKSGNLGNKLKKLDEYHNGNKEKLHQYISNNCSFRYMVIEDLRKLKFLEHFCIAVLDPKLND